MNRFVIKQIYLPSRALKICAHSGGVGFKSKEMSEGNFNRIKQIIKPTITISRRLNSLRTFREVPRDVTCGCTFCANIWTKSKFPARAVSSPIKTFAEENFADSKTSRTSGCLASEITNSQNDFTWENSCNWKLSSESWLKDLSAWSFQHWEAIDEHPSCLIWCSVESMTASR